MQILGFHIISDAELQKELSKASEKARKEQRELNNHLVAGLLRSAEYYRKQAGSKVILVPRRPWTISESRKRREDKKVEPS